MTTLPPRPPTQPSSPLSSSSSSRQKRWNLPRESYIVDADTLSAYEPLAQQVIGLLIWLFSLAGTVLSVDGWDGTRSSVWSIEFITSIGIAIAMQLFITAIQLITCKHWQNPLYLLSIAASSFFSFLGFREPIAIPLTVWVTGIAIDPFAPEHTEQVAAIAKSNPEYLLVATAMHMFVFATMVFADIVPERIFVRHQ